MPVIVDTLYDTYIKPYKNVMLIVFLLIIFIITSYYAYNRYYFAPEKTVFADVANADRTTKEANIAFFSASWCPHCTAAKPEWDKFTQQYNNTEVNGYIVVCSNIDMSTADEEGDVNHDLVAQYNIKGYPTVKMTYNGNTVDYDAKISYGSLVKFVNTLSP